MRTQCATPTMCPCGEKSVKSGSKADRAALRQQLLDAGGSVDEVAAEMRRRWRFRPRESYRHAHGWSQDEVAGRFTGVAARLAPGTRSAPMVGTRIGEYERWPLGGRRPSPYVLTVLAEVYGTDPARLLPRRVRRPVSRPLPAAPEPAAPARPVPPPPLVPTVPDRPPTWPRLA